MNQKTPQRLLQACDIVVDPAKMTDMPEPIAVMESRRGSFMTGVTVDLLGAASTIEELIEFSLDSRGVINRDVLETSPDVPVG